MPYQIVFEYETSEGRILERTRRYALRTMRGALSAGRRAMASRRAGTSTLAIWWVSRDGDYLRREYVWRRGRFYPAPPEQPDIDAYTGTDGSFAAQGSDGLQPQLGSQTQ